MRYRKILVIMKIAFFPLSLLFLYFVLAVLYAICPYCKKFSFTKIFIFGYDNLIQAFDELDADFLATMQPWGVYDFNTAAAICSYVRMTEFFIGMGILSGFLLLFASIAFVMCLAYSFIFEHVDKFYDDLYEKVDFASFDARYAKSSYSSIVREELANTWKFAQLFIVDSFELSWRIEFTQAFLMVFFYHDLVNVLFIVMYFIVMISLIILHFIKIFNELSLRFTFNNLDAAASSKQANVKFSLLDYLPNFKNLLTEVNSFVHINFSFLRVLLELIHYLVSAYVLFYIVFWLIMLFVSSIVKSYNYDFFYNSHVVVFSIWLILAWLLLVLFIAVIRFFLIKKLTRLGLSASTIGTVLRVLAVLSVVLVSFSFVHIFLMYAS